MQRNLFIKVQKGGKIGNFLLNSNMVSTIKCISCLYFHLFYYFYDIKTGLKSKLTTLSEAFLNLCSFPHENA